MGYYMNLDGFKKAIKYLLNLDVSGKGYTLEALQAEWNLDESLPKYDFKKLANQLGKKTFVGLLEDPRLSDVVVVEKVKKYGMDVKVYKGKMPAMLSHGEKFLRMSLGRMKPPNERPPASSSTASRQENDENMMPMRSSTPKNDVQEAQHAPESTFVPPKRLVKIIKQSRNDDTPTSHQREPSYESEQYSNELNTHQGHPRQEIQTDYNPYDSGYATQEPSPPHHRQQVTRMDQQPDDARMHQQPNRFQREHPLHTRTYPTYDPPRVGEEFNQRRPMPPIDFHGPLSQPSQHLEERDQRMPSASFHASRRNVKFELPEQNQDYERTRRDLAYEEPRYEYYNHLDENRQYRGASQNYERNGPREQSYYSQQPIHRSSHMDYHLNTSHRPHDPSPYYNNDQPQTSLPPNHAHTTRRVEPPGVMLNHLSYNLGSRSQHIAMTISAVTLLMGIGRPVYLDDVIDRARPILGKAYYDPKDWIEFIKNQCFDLEVFVKYGKPEKWEEND